MGFLASMALLLGYVFNVSGEEPKPIEAPALSQVGPWFNSQGLELKDLRGKVVVLHFWTFGCINCQRNLPYYNAWQKDFSNEPLAIIGVHTPEFKHEADSAAIAEQIKQRKIEYPVTLDSKNATWLAYNNRFWPAIYLIDKQGRIRQRWEGELEFNNAGGDKKMRAMIKELLAE
jgi:thiol-disulfide isomerase/thioredoxin